MSSTTSGIPVVDFSSLSLNHRDEELDESGIKTIADEIINAYSTLGFVYLSNTQFPEQLVRQCCLYKTRHASVRQLSAECGLTLSSDVLVSRRSRDPLRLRPWSRLGRVGKLLGLGFGMEGLGLGIVSDS